MDPLFPKGSLKKKAGSADIPAGDPAQAPAGMPMVTLKRYLNRNEEEVVLRKVVDLLLEKISTSAVAANESESTVFREDIGRIRDQIGPEALPSALLLAAGSATQALEGYNKGITRLIRKQGEQLQSIIAMMTDTVVKVGGQHLRSVQRLQDIGDGLERAGVIRDFETLKVHLGECLNSFRVETLRQKEESDNLIQHLRQEVERCSPAALMDGNTDLASGLGNTAAGIKAMQEPVPIGKRRYVVTMVVGRIQSINARFGQQAGDRILSAFGTFVWQQLGQADRLFRWNGPAFMALLERTEPLDQVRTQIKRMLEKPLQENFEVGDRSVLIPISAAWSAFQHITTVATAEKQIQTFIASQSSREYV
jgi:GGDEF domain-containing protein